MILTDREIQGSLSAGLLDIKPTPPVDAYSSTSVDLTLGNVIQVFRESSEDVDAVIDPARPNYSVRRLLKRETTDTLIGESGYVLRRDILILGWTAEMIALHGRGRIAARVEGKSNLARIGLAVHVTAPTIHAGFKGPIQLEIINHGPLPIKLRPGMRICQLIFEQTLGMPERGYQGQFLDQGPTG